jgi:hypothetical protein
MPALTPITSSPYPPLDWFLTCVTLRITDQMISSIRHRGLKRLYENDDPRGVMAEHVTKLRDILGRLDAARTVADMDMPVSGCISSRAI